MQSKSSIPHLLLTHIVFALAATAQDIPAEARNQPREQQMSAESGRNTTVVSRSSISRSKAPLGNKNMLAVPGITLLKNVATPSPAEAFDINGNYAYVCDDNEVSIIDISTPSNPRIVATATSPLIQNTGNISCSVQSNSLFVFADQVNSNIGNAPGFVAFNLSSPLSPQLIASTPINKRFFQNPVFIGNTAFVPTAALTYFLGFQWDSQFGDLLAINLSNPASPQVTGTLAQPQVSAIYGGSNPVFGATQGDAATLYIGGTSSTQNLNNGTGRLQVVDISNPSSMKVLSQLSIPGSVHFNAPLIEGTVGIGVGNSGGYVGAFNANPGTKGQIVIATFDLSDRRTPSILSAKTTSYTVGAGGGATRIGNHLFAFAGVLDSSGNPVLLVVDTTDPRNPVLQGYPIPQPFTAMKAIGNTLYATLGSGGFATFSIPGNGSTTPSSCPISVSTVIVLDQGVGTAPASFANAKAAAKSFIDSMNLAPDQIAIVGLADTATLSQQLTTTAQQAKYAIDLLAPRSSSYLGAGITAAQAELTSPRRSSGSAPVILLVSDGADRSAPNGSATLNAANAAKAAGLRIISLQYGSGPTSLMQSLASAPSDFYQVPTP